MRRGGGGRPPSDRAVRLYRWALRAYPVRFRAEYGEDCVRLFRRLLEGKREGGPRWTATLLWSVQALWYGMVERAAERGRRRGGAGSERSGRGEEATRMDRIAQDLRFAGRSLRRRPGFAALTVGLLALGIGATTTIFSVVDAVLLRPLPYPGADRLVALQKGSSSVPVPDFRDWRDRTRSFETWGAARRTDLDLTGAGEPVRLPAAEVTPEFLRMLGAGTVRGRPLDAEDFRPAGPTVAVIAHELWTGRFGADPGLVGRTISLDGEPVTVVGVLEPGFRAPEGLRLADTRVWTPLDLSDPELQDRHLFVLKVLARRRADVPPEAADAEIDALEAAMREEYPDSYVWRDGTPVEIQMAGLRERTLGDVGDTLVLFLGAVGLMLLIACANVANLFLARGTERRREMAVRAALGAGRIRIARQLLTESLVVAGLGGAAGLVLAALGVHGFRLLRPEGIPRAAEVTLDLRVALFAGAVAALTGILFGLVPALSSAGVRPQSTLRTGGYASSEAREGRRLRSALVVAQTALALMLLVGAGLLFHAFLELRGVEMGFRPERLTTLQLDLEARVEPDAYDEFAERLRERIAALPGVTAVGASWRLPFDRGRCCWANASWAPGGTDTISPYVHPVTEGYFEALEIPLLRGRPIRNGDAPRALGFDGIEEGGEPVELPAVAGRGIVERLWPGTDPLGGILAPRSFDGVTFRIVGVAEDVRHWSAASEPGLNLYVPFASVAHWIGLLDVAVRHEADAGAVISGIRRAVRALDPDLPIDRIVPMEDRIGASMATERFLAVLLGSFAGFAFALAAAGIYGAMAYDVGRRRRELGIRIALGAEGGRVIRLVLGRGLALAALGLALGLGGALALSRLLEGLLYGVETTDPLTYGLVTAGLAAAALTACWVPAARAARTDPAATLRAE